MSTAARRTAVVRKRPAAKKKGGGGFGRFLRGLAIVAVLGILAFAGIVAGVIASYSSHLPDINRMADFQPERSTQVFARDGQLLAGLYRQNRIWVQLDRVPVTVRNAFVASEDAHFYSHHGIDFEGILRAAVADWRHQPIQGGSTITQQLARGLFLSNEVSLSRKIQEALLAIEIERYYTKDEILERYLNLIYLGSGAYGVQAAAHTYFGTDVGKLTLGQAAMLAGIVPAPSDYSPYVNMDLARERQRHVLDRMVANGFINRQAANDAAEEPINLIGERPAGLQSYRFPYFTTYVVHKLDETFGTQATFEGGLTVYTTLDPAMQELAQKTIAWGVATAAAEGINAHQAALVAIRPQTGEILAMVGGSGWSLNNQFNRAWQARRQPGSSFKVYVYTAAIDSGIPPTEVVYDTPVSYPMGDGTQWAPQDDDHRFWGAMTLRQALAQSRNVVAVKLAERLGIDRVIEYAKRMGIKEKLEPNLSLALGSEGVSPLEQAAGYATLADAGIHIDPSPIRLVKDSFGSVVLDNQYPQQTEVVSAGTAFVVTQMLTSVIKEGTGYPNAIIGRPAAGKTGTTSDFRDAWFVGYTPDLVAAVWLGNDNYARMDESYGGNIPARMWARFMKGALADTPHHEFEMPKSEVRKVRLCGSGRIEYFLAGTGPAESCGSLEEAPPKAAPVPAATPTDVPPGMVGDGEHFMKLDNSPPTAAPAATP
ncbi:MAG: PBP1A family penicillin-binding protein [Candidatus Eremiobacteraeota bacterium]|nr:PBP1A family penicillin-binding protein [Candidatus Eremiobacteraeota bacterium]